MLPLNDLTVATGATQLFAKTELRQVRFVVEDDALLKSHTAFKQMSLMATGTQAVFIVDFSPGLGALVNARGVVDQH